MYAMLELESCTACSCAWTDTKGYCHYLGVTGLHYMQYCQLQQLGQQSL